MHKKTTAAIAAVLAAAALILTGCSSGSDAASVGAASTSAKPVSGGTLTVGISDWCGAFDKQQTSGCNFANIQITDNLVDQDPKTGKIVPWLATAWKISDDGKQYTFTLRKGVTFSNGEVFDAQAVKDNFDSIIVLGKQGNAFQSSAYLLGYTGSTVIDPTHLQVEFSTPKAGFLQSLSEAPLGIVSPSTTKETAQQRADGVIGSGPFVLKSITQDKEIVLERRHDYTWGSPLRGNTGPAYLKEVDFKVIPDASARIGALTSGQIDAISYPSSNNISEVKSSSNVFKRASAGVVYTLYPNTANPILSQLPVRQAIQHSINRPEIKKVLLDSTTDAATNIVSTSFPGYEDLSSKLAYSKSDVTKILTKAGWQKGSDGIWAKDGTRLSVDLQYSDPTQTQLYELIQQQLRANGIELQLKQLTAAQITANQASGDWGLYYGNLTRPDPDVFLSAFTAKFAAPRIKTDPDPSLAALIEQQSSELDTAKRTQESHQIQERLIDEGLGFPIEQATSVIATKKTVHGVGFTAPWWAIFGAAWKEQQ